MNQKCDQNIKGLQYIMQIIDLNTVMINDSIWIDHFSIAADILLKQ